MREPRSALQACKLPFKKILLLYSPRTISVIGEREREREKKKGALCDEFGIGRAIEKRTDLAAILLGFELSRTRSSGVFWCAASSCRQARLGRREKSSFSQLLLLFFFFFEIRARRSRGAIGVDVVVSAGMHWRRGLVCFTTPFFVLFCFPPPSIWHRYASRRALA